MQTKYGNSSWLPADGGTTVPFELLKHQYTVSTVFSYMSMISQFQLTGVPVILDRVMQLF